MKKHLLLLLAFLTITLGALAQKTEKETDKALEFNDYCASITDTLYQYGQEWGTEVTKAIENKNFNKIALINKKLVAFIDKKKKELLRKEVYPDMDNLKIATLDFLTFEKEMITNNFVSFEQFNAQSTTEAIEEETQKLLKAAEKEGKVLETLREEQIKVSKIYGFDIEEE